MLCAWELFILFFLEPNVATTKVAVTTKPEATTKAGLKTTQVTEMTTLTPVSTTPAVTTVVPVTTTPSPIIKTVLTKGIRYESLTDHYNSDRNVLCFSACFNVIRIALLLGASFSIIVSMLKYMTQSSCLFSSISLAT